MLSYESMVLLSFFAITRLAIAVAETVLLQTSGLILAFSVPVNRLTNGFDLLAHEEGSKAMTAQHLRDLESKRRYATLVALILDTRATLIDEDLHDRIMGTLFNQAKRHHAERFRQARRSTRCVSIHTCVSPIGANLRPKSLNML
jgi:hypothetical protein